MPRYLRSRDGTSYFFTLVTNARRPILCDIEVRAALKNALSKVRLKRPFRIDAFVLMPDHLHCIWTMPDGDADFSSRWKIIKGSVAVACRSYCREDGLLSLSRQRHRESTFWQRRFWEHQIRDENDFERHADYIHFNPVKHGLANRAVDWPYSTFHRYVAQGIYVPDWGGGDAAHFAVPE